MPTNINQILQMLNNGGNPQQMAMNMMEQQMGNNPMFRNLLDLAKQGRGNEVELIARNIMKERGLDFDTEFNNFKRAMKF